MSGKLFKQIDFTYGAYSEESRQEYKDRLLNTIRTCESISQLASIVRLDWDKVYFGAVPYLQAMRTLETKSDNYGLDSATSIVLYFLSNATTWKGEVAREVKKRLKKLVEVK